MKLSDDVRQAAEPTESKLKCNETSPCWMMRWNTEGITQIFNNDGFIKSKTTKAIDT